MTKNAFFGNLIVAKNTVFIVVIAVIGLLLLLGLILIRNFLSKKATDRKEKETADESDVLPDGKEEAPAAEAEEQPAENAPEESPEEISLSASLAAAKEKGVVGLVGKASIIDHLAATFGEKVELNGRANRTPNGKLLMSDNHFAFAPDDKRVCFTYVYEDDDGSVVILLRTTAEHAAEIRAAHPATGGKSAFPKNKKKDWYSLVIDDTFTEEGVYADLDRAARNIIEAEIPALPEASTDELSLKESLAAAKVTGAVGIVSKKDIIAYLVDRYGDKVEVNGRENRTPNGKLLLSDNHFALDEGKRVCFTYVYEDDGRITILLRASVAAAKAIRASHASTGLRSAFPKNKDKDWYSVVVDDTFTKSDLQKILDESVSYVLAK